MLGAEVGTERVQGRDEPHGVDDELRWHGRMVADAVAASGDDGSAGGAPTLDRGASSGRGRNGHRPAKSLATLRIAPR